jgi:hypothetical protein
MIRRAWVLSVVLAVACGGKKKEAAPEPATGSGSAAAVAETVEAGRLISEAEIKTWIDALLARLDANAKRRCTPPRISDKQTPGPGTDLLVQLFEGKGELASCMTRLGELGKGGTLKADVEAGLPSVIAFDDACGALITDKVLDAAAHTEGCSPYQVGVRVEPKELMRAIQIAHALSFHARKLATAGKTDEAIELSLAGLRVMQDLMRGHVTLIIAMIGAASTQIVADRVDAILETAKLTEEQRALFAAAMDSLIVGVPLWADVMAGERDNMDIYFGTAQLMPKTWIPPGGWNEAMRPKDGDQNAFPTTHFGDPRDEHAIMLQMTTDNAADLERVCPEGASYALCHKGMETLAAAAKPAASADLKALYGELTQAATSGAPDLAAIRKRIRASISQILRSVTQPNLTKYPIKLAEMISRLAAVRIHLEVMKGPCPTAEALAAPPYTVLASPPPLGDKVTLATAPGTVSVGPPGWVDPVKVWTFACAN